MGWGEVGKEGKRGGGGGEGMRETNHHLSIQFNGYI